MVYPLKITQQQQQKKWTTDTCNIRDETSLKKLHTLWFHLYIMENVKYKYPEYISGCQGLGVSE